MNIVSYFCVNYFTWIKQMKSKVCVIFKNSIKSYFQIQAQFVLVNRSNLSPRLGRYPRACVG
jgi:hypothetical protein